MQDAPPPTNMLPKLSQCEPDTPAHILALADYARSGIESNEFPIGWLINSGYVSWPVGYKPELTPGAFAMLALFGASA